MLTLVAAEPSSLLVDNVHEAQAQVVISPVRVPQSDDVVTSAPFTIAIGDSLAVHNRKQN